MKELKIGDSVRINPNLLDSDCDDDLKLVGEVVKDVGYCIVDYVLVKWNSNALNSYYKQSDLVLTIQENRDKQLNKILYGI
jgi:hypothetical protein